ncbi:MAG TPA: hypothetical protein VFN22_11010 [Gemmatimonadales bacterium]|nr:hypothetical protein [Gemmatimonadales bacterium]
MSTAGRLGIFVALLSGCSSLPTTGDGVVELRVEIPADLKLESGATRTLTARAFDRTGAEVSTTIVWETPDTTVSVDPVTGVVTGLTASGTGRVQASTGTLRSNLIVFTLVPPATAAP